MVEGAHGSEASSSSEDEDEDDGGVFTAGDCLRFQLTFGAGPLGLVLANTKAGRGVYVQDFAKVPTRHGPVATAAELSGVWGVGVWSGVGQSSTVRRALG